MAFSWLCFTLVLCCQTLSVMCTNIVSKDDHEVNFINFFHKPELVLIESSLSVFNVTNVESCQFDCLYHASCLSINFGSRTTNPSSFSCELNNSTSLAKPLKMRRRKGFDFYGPADPCFSNSCLNGGTCISNLAEASYRCNCSLQIAVFPYIDNHCATDKKLRVGRSGVYHYVFNMWVVKTYSLNYYEAQRACAIFGAKMASLPQLKDGWRVGFDDCSWGWLIDATVRFPKFIPPKSAGCVLGPPGIRGSTTPNDKTKRFNVYCFKETDQCNEEDWHQNDKTCYKFYLNTKARWSEASNTCVQEGGTLGVFNTRGKLHFVKDFVRRRNSSAEQIVVGLRQEPSVGWKWSGGKSVDSNLWNTIQPSGPIGTVNVRLISLDNVPDSDQWKLPFVCQKGLP